MKKINQFIIFGIFFCLLMIIGWGLSDNIISGITSIIPEGIEIIAFNPMEVLTTSLSIALLFATIITLPFIIYKGVKYVKPAMYKDEKKTLNRVLFSGTLLFLSGFAFAFFGFVYFGLTWLSGFNTSYGFATLWGVQKTLTTILFTSFMAGLIFEFPMVLYYLTKKEIINLKLNAQKRILFLIVLTLGIGILTPDGSMITQIILSVPIYSLTEMSLYLGNKHREVNNDRISRTLDSNSSDSSSVFVWKKISEKDV